MPIKDPNYVKAVQAWEPIITSIENIERASGPNMIGAAEDFDFLKVKKYVSSVKKDLSRIEKSLVKIKKNRLSDSKHNELSIGQQLTISVGKCI